MCLVLNYIVYVNKKLTNLHILYKKICKTHYQTFSIPGPAFLEACYDIGEV